MNPFIRTEWLIGREAVKKLAGSKVAVFGIGGVGSFAAEGLARAGVGKLVLIDHEVVELSNLNRQIHATMKTIGKPKVELMKERIQDINPAAEVIAYREFYVAGLSDMLIDNDLDYIVDAIDSISSKIDLIVKAKEKGIPIISGMGAGNKFDPLRVKVGDIYDTAVCPLAKVMRKELKKRNIASLKVVYSTEEPVKPIRINSDTCINSEENQTDNSSSDSGSDKHPADKHPVKKNPPGSVVFVPSVFGLIIASEVVKDLIGRGQPQGGLEA